MGLESSKPVLSPKEEEEDLKKQEEDLIFQEKIKCIIDSNITNNIFYKLSKLLINKKEDNGDYILDLNIMVGNEPHGTSLIKKWLLNKRNEKHDHMLFSLIYLCKRDDIHKYIDDEIIRLIKNNESEFIKTNNKLIIYIISNIQNLKSKYKSELTKINNKKKYLKYKKKYLKLKNDFI